MKTLILGAGFSGLQIARKAQAFGAVCGTRRTTEGVAQLASQGIPGCILDGKASAQFLAELSAVTHLVIGVAPERLLPLHDPMLCLLESLPPAVAAWPSLSWVGYLSTIGVYGDHDGQWVTEDTPCTSTQLRSLARREAELAWQRWGHQRQVPVSILRLSGIYGPGRNAVEDALTGRARLLIKPGQVFNRIHVDDLAEATLAAARGSVDGILNITDNEPAPPQDVVRFAHSLVGRAAPAAEDFATAELSPMARSFYSENKRVCNQRSRTVLDMSYRYPDYRAGLTAIWREVADGMSGESPGGS